LKRQLLRIATMGSIREARRAGMYPASKATPSSSMIIPPNGTGSPTVVSKSNDWIPRATTSEAAVPIATLSWNACGRLCLSAAVE
jgi:hypothetical protein